MVVVKLFDLLETNKDGLAERHDFDFVKTFDLVSHDNLMNSLKKIYLKSNL